MLPPLVTCRITVDDFSALACIRLWFLCPGAEKERWAGGRNINRRPLAETEPNTMDEGSYEPPEQHDMDVEQVTINCIQ